MTAMMAFPPYPMSAHDTATSGLDELDARPVQDVAFADTRSERGVARADEPHDDRPWWKQAPIAGRWWLFLLGVYVAATAGLTLVGLGIVELWEPSALGDRDAGVNRWFAERRTPTLDRWTHYGSMLSGTLTMVALCILLLPVLLWIFRRWHDWTLLAVGLVLEVTTFVTTATLVGRDRPPVEQLDGAPTNSFPSGHIAAATVFYVGLALVVCWHTRNRWVRAPFLLLAVLAPAAVITSRMYRGMHYPTDALFGLVLGTLVLLAVRSAMVRTRGGRTLSTVD